MNISIMQPYFLPYYGYFQLIAASDIFVIYDNIEFTKKGWMHRNRFLLNGSPEYFSVSLKKDSDFLNVCDRKIAENFDREKLIRQIENAYRKAPYFSEIFPYFKQIVLFPSDNLFEYIYNSTTKILEILEINTKIVVSSSLEIDHSLRSQDKVIAITECLNGDVYLNAPGGRALYEASVFQSKQIQLRFLCPKELIYSQFQMPFVPYLSILDPLMFKGIEEMKIFINEAYEVEV